MKKGFLKSLLIAVFCGFYAFGATAAVSLFSDYGQIQNVQNYSTNPFWTPNSPYNQRLPQPVYVQGADLTADDCFKVVQSLVSVQCMARDNCKNTTLADIRPTIMVQLSNLPGNNYVSACSGFIDGVFESYVVQYGNNIPNRAAAFPNATTPNPDINKDNDIKIQNPYKRTIPQWQQEIIERSNELEQLRQESGAGSEHLSATDFPATYADLSFTDRVKLATADYAQYKDKNAYTVPNIQNLKDWCAGKGAGSAECASETTEQTTAQNTDNQSDNQSGGDDSAPPIDNQNDGTETPVAPEERIYSARACYYPKGIISGSCANGRVSTGRNWLGNLCLSICDTDPITDDLNTKVLYPIMKKKYCVDKSTREFRIVEHESHQPITLTKQQYEEIKTKIKSDLADKGACDKGYLKLDIQFGTFNSGTFGLIENVHVDN